jgi:hypothetical protein
MNTDKEIYIARFRVLIDERDIAIEDARNRFLDGSTALYNEMVRFGIIKQGEIPPWLEASMLGLSNPSSLDIPSVRKVYLESMRMPPNP